jgi:hypothetical protein
MTASAPTITFTLQALGRKRGREGKEIGKEGKKG